MKPITAKEIPAVREKLLKRQKGICPICKDQIKDPCLDHDHTTGAVRGVLCRNCNRVEGKVLHWVRTIKGSNVQIIRNIALYWVKHSVNRTGLLHPGKRKGKKKKRRGKNNKKPS